MKRSLPHRTVLSVLCCVSLAAACAKGGDSGGDGGGDVNTSSGTTSSGSGGTTSSGSGGTTSSGGGGSSSGTGGSSSGSGGTTSSGSGGSGGDPDLCDNGYLDPGEQCDQTNYGGETCNTLGFNGGGVLACDAVTCTFDTSGCISSFCGDDVADPGEECDGADLAGATCQGVGLAGGPMSCDGSCLLDSSGCYDHYTQNFEGGSIPPGWSTSGNAGWTVTTGNAHGGAFGAASGAISHNQVSSLFLTLTFDVDGTLSFWHKESCESGWDYLILYMDGSFIQQWSGTTNQWAEASFDVTAGVHTFEWRYDKDGSVTVGFDKAWIDDLTTVNGYLP